MSNILFKVWVARFYKINTGFFLFFFILLFGLLNGQATIDLHHQVMRGITGSFTFLLSAMAVWALYNYKCISFCIKELHSPENGFLFQLQGVDDKKQMRLLLQVQAALLLPLLVYAGVTVSVGIADKHYLHTTLFAIFQLAMCIAGALIYLREINGTWRKPALSLPLPALKVRKHFTFYLLHYSLHARKGTFIGVKICSLLVLQAMVAANADKLSREAICVLIMFLVSAHSLLPYYYVRFVEGGMAFLRNIPIATTRRLMQYTITYAVVFLPELLFLLLNERHVMPVQLTLSLYAVGVSQLLLYTALQYLPGMRTERYTGFVFGLFFVTLLFLASFNLWLLFLAEALVATLAFLLLYNRYELTEQVR